MNTSIVFRFVNRTSKVFSKHVQYSRSLQQVGCSRMLTNVSTLRSQKEKEVLEDELSNTINALANSPKFSQIPEVGSWIKKVLEYNLAGGKKGRGLSTVIAYEMFEKPEDITEESLRLARILGCCVEMLQAYFLVLDDIMDGSVTRRGEPCWYRIPEVSFGALNDSIFIYTSIFQTLKTYFGNTPQYVDMLDLFNEIILYTSIGQHLDYTMAHRNKNDYSLFTIERYSTITQYKSAYYTYKLPVCLGLLLANKTYKDTNKIIEEISIEMGALFQIQDDYIDCFGEESVTGKKGTDIAEGKCTWLAVTALQQCDAAQRAVFAACYGSAEPAHAERVQQLYRALDLPRQYACEERARYDAIAAKIRALPDSLSPALFLKFLDDIYQRKK